jgi:hypothetical protein
MSPTYLAHPNNHVPVSRSLTFSKTAILLAILHNFCLNSVFLKVANGLHSQIIIFSLHFLLSTYICIRVCGGGAGSSVGIATSYGLNGPGIESRWGRDFPTCLDRPWSPPSLLFNGNLVFPGGKLRPGRAADHSLPSSAEVLEE